MLGNIEFLFTKHAVVLIVWVILYDVDAVFGQGRELRNCDSLSSGDNLALMGSLRA